MKKIEELDAVEAVRDIADTPVKAGMVGTVTLVFGGGAAFYVEFLDADGYTLYEDTLPVEAVRLVKSNATASRELVAA